MDLASMTSEQRQELLMAAAERRDWFDQLRARMAAQSWPPDDPLWLRVTRAYEAADQVVAELVKAEQDDRSGRPAHHRLWNRLGRDPRGRAG